MKKILILLTLTLVYSLAGETTNDDCKLYVSATQLFGRSLVADLIRACERTPDEKLSDAKTVCVKVMENSGNSIASIRWYHPTKTKISLSYGPVGTFSGVTALGTHVSGHVMGSTKSSRTKQLSLKKDVPPGIVKGFPIMEQAAKREKHPEAYAEVGAAIFLGVTDGKIGYGAKKMHDCFKKAAELGSLNGMYMYAFCVANGVGCKKDYEKGCRLVKEWKGKMAAGLDSSKSNDIWSNRRLGDVEKICDAKQK